MADFLTRLAGRTLGVVPTVQPMMAPMYAPGFALATGQSGLVGLEEEVSGGAQGQSPLSPAGRDRMDFPVRVPLQEPGLAEGQESRADREGIFTSSMPFSSQQSSSLLQPGDRHARATQPAMPSMSRNSTVDKQNTLSSIFVTGEGGQQSVTHRIPPSTPSAPSPSPDKMNSLRIEEVHSSPSEASQMQLEAASFFVQEQWSGEDPPTSMNNNSVGRQRTPSNLRQPAMPENSHSRTSIRWAAADSVTANRYETVPEAVAPTAPSIQVTIGRIEVRATPPPPAQRQTTRPGPRVMSLEDYLNQQARGGQ